MSKSLRAAGSDREAMVEIVREHYATVYRFCARRIGPDLAQDAAQETFVSAQGSLRRFDGRSSLRTWLLGIAHNHCRNLARKARPEESWLNEDEMNTEAMDGGARTILNRQALRQAMAGLTPEHREAVILHELDGLTYEEAAKIAGVPAGTIKSRLYYAFEQLRKSLTEEGAK